MPLQYQYRQRSNSLPRTIAGARRQAQESKSPGQVGDKLRRKMGDALADIFSTAGVKLYSDIVLELKNGLETLLKEGIGGLEQTIKEELGNRGLGHAADLFKPWISELIQEIITFGLEEISGGLEDIASDAAAEFSVKPEDEDEAEEALLGTEEEPEEVESVEEEPVAEPAAEGEGADVSIPRAVPDGTEESATGFELPEGEAAAAPGDPYQPRTWRQRGKKRLARTTVKLTPQQLTNWIGGIDSLQQRAKTVTAALALLQQVQAKAIRKIVASRATIAVRETDPLELLDYVHKHFSYR